jgi:hypothetical protein
VPEQDRRLTHRSWGRALHTQLAWEAWSDTPAGKPVTLGCVMNAHDRLVRTIERSEYASVLNVLISGDEGGVNEIRALQLLADRGGTTINSRPLAPLYGFSSHLTGPSRPGTPAGAWPSQP